MHEKCYMLRVLSCNSGLQCNTTLSFTSQHKNITNYLKDDKGTIISRLFYTQIPNFKYTMKASEQ